MLDQELHLEPSLDALRLRSDVISSIKILSFSSLDRAPSARSRDKAASHEFSMIFYNLFILS